MAKAQKEFYSGGKFYAVGADVPDDVAAKVAASLVDEQPEVDTSTFDGGEAFEAAVEARVKAALAEELDAEAYVAQGAQEQREREQAAVDVLAELDEPYDPTADGVKAKDVHDYLSGLDRDTVAGSGEYDRVVAAEKAGDDRSTAIPAEPAAD